jgi:hypothetical protein
MPRFSLRDLVAVVTIVALGWTVDHWRLARNVRRWRNEANTLNEVNVLVSENRPLWHAVLSEAIARVELKKTLHDLRSDPK